MSLPTEAEKLEAFRAAYPGEHEVLKPVIGTSFEIVTFDPETKYAQFREAVFSHRGYVEFAQAGGKTPILRYRYYCLFAVEGRKTQSLGLDSVDVEYPLRGNQVHWYFRYDLNDYGDSGMKASTREPSASIPDLSTNTIYLF